LGIGGPEAVLAEQVANALPAYARRVEKLIKGRETAMREIADKRRAARAELEAAKQEAASTIRAGADLDVMQLVKAQIAWNVLQDGDAEPSLDALKPTAEERAEYERLRKLKELDAALLGWRSAAEGAKTMRDRFRSLAGSGITGYFAPGSPGGIFVGGVSEQSAQSDSKRQMEQEQRRLDSYQAEIAKLEKERDALLSSRGG